MIFDEVLAQVRELLEREGRVSYRALKRRFGLDNDYLQDLKDELIDAQQVARDQDGKVLVWVGSTTVVSSQLSVVSSSPPPAPQTSDAGLRTPESRPQTLDSFRPEAERRQLTVMFCDLVGSTALSAQLDPEELRVVVRAYQETCAAVIRRYEGHIAQYLGDGLLVYFGYPVAHEDDAARAVRAGLEIVETFRGQETGITDQDERQNLTVRFSQPLQVRIGIHTGPVVVGEMGGGNRQEQLALGETPNIAARVQGQAEPDTVVISAATYRLVEGLFECEERGRPELKGVSAPLTLYRVVKAGEAQSRFEVVARQGLTPLVGRAPELGLLQERWERVKDGAGQIVLLGGEPGIGKSRLVEALKDSLAPEDAPCLELRCSPYAQNSALQPLIEHLQRLLQFRPEDSPESKLARLQQTLSHYHFPQTDTLPLFAALLSLPLPSTVPPLALSPQKQKEKTHEAIVAWLCAEATQQAVCYAWEDLHWADPSTLELLTLLLAQVPTTRLLVVLTFRSEFTPPWGTHAYLSQLTLSRLGRTQGELMVEKVIGGKALPPEVVQQIVRKTDGVPLFIEELTKSVVESVEAIHESPLQLGIPTTLHDALMARLDRLGSAKEIAQMGATIGREFTYHLLQAVSPLNEETLRRGLQQLVEAELVYQNGIPPQARYLFKHALIQDAAYQSLLKGIRQKYHKQIASVLEERFSETKQTQPELVAHHYTEAGLSAQAIPYWQRAGQRAIERSANLEAISHCHRGLELLMILSDTPERTQEELTLQTTLGHALTATKGWSNPEVGAAYTRSLELCRQVGDSSQLSQALVGLLSFYIEAPQFQTAQELGKQLLDLAQKTHDQPLLAEAHLLLGFILFFHGEIALAGEHLQQGIPPHASTQGRSRAILYGYDPRVPCWFVMACALWVLGYPDQALKSNEEALALAQEISLTYSSSVALYWAATFHRLRRDMQVTQERAEDLITLCTEQGFMLFLAWGTILRGSVLAEQGEREQGITHIQQGLTASRATGGGLRQPYWLALLAEAYGKVGQVEEGLSVLAEALAVMDKTEERWCEAELYRLKGTLTLQSQTSLGQVSDKSQASQNKSEDTDPRPLTPDSQGEAEACFLKAIDIARRQQAKSLELRAVMSLSQLWQQQGKKEEAHQLLSDIYDWFTEGFDTKDLQEAKALLDSLGSSV